MALYKAHLSLTEGLPSRPDWQRLPLPCIGFGDLPAGRDDTEVVRR